MYWPWLPTSVSSAVPLESFALSENVNLRLPSLPLIGDVDLKATVKWSACALGSVSHVIVSLLHKTTYSGLTPGAPTWVLICTLLAPVHGNRLELRGGLTTSGLEHCMREIAMPETTAN